jgi:hypothetical protein
MTQKLNLKIGELDRLNGKSLFINLELKDADVLKLERRIHRDFIINQVIYYTYLQNWSFTVCLQILLTNN